MQPYTVSENDWISLVPLTPTGAIDVVALEAAVRKERARVLGGLFARLFRRGKRRATQERAQDRLEARKVQRELDRAAVA
ncbi:MAG: hypothetical protein AB7R90_08190 [Reyranellaceae bacterium]